MEKIKKFFNSLKQDVKLRNRVIICGAAALVLIVLIIVLCVSCGNNGSNPGGTSGSTESTGPDAPVSEVAYTVTVKDALGNPYGNDVVVNFINGGNIVAMQPLNEQGIAEKVLSGGEYTVELSFLADGASYYYDTTNLTLTDVNSSVEIILSQAMSENTTELGVYSAVTGTNQSYAAHYIGTGCTYVTLDTADRNYVIFVPSESGEYRFFAPDSDVSIGYYGNVHYIQAENIAALAEDGSFTISVSPSMINTDGGSTIAIVLGIDSNGSSDCVFSIERIGDHVMTIEDYPWDIYQTTAVLSAFTLPENVTLVDFDVTAATETYKLVYNEADGCYHLDSADGPVVYMKLGVDSAYLDSIQTVLESSGIVRYFFDENGDFVSKQSYSECLLEYIGYMDADAGVYPLTEDLKFIIQQRGEYVGWWNSSSETFLFVDENGVPVSGLNSQIAWLFLCCYGEVEETVSDDPDPDNSSNSGTGSGNTSGSGNNSGSGSSSGSGNNAGSGNTSDSGSDSGDKEDTFQIGTESSAATVEIYYHMIKDTESFEAAVKAGEYANYDFWKLTGKVLTIYSEDVYIIYDGEVYRPDDNGVLSFPLVFESNFYPCSLAIGNAGDEDVIFDVSLGTPVGDYMNPKKLSLGSFTTKLSAGDEDGYYYSYTATADGIFSITLDSITSGVECNIVITNDNVDATASDALTAGDDNVVSLVVKEGDVVRISIGVADSDLPAATITATASLD